MSYMTPVPFAYFTPAKDEKCLGSFHAQNMGWFPVKRNGFFGGVTGLREGLPPAHEPLHGHITDQGLVLELRAGQKDIPGWLINALKLSSIVSGISLFDLAAKFTEDSKEVTESIKSGGLAQGSVQYKWDQIHYIARNDNAVWPVPKPACYGWALPFVDKYLRRKMTPEIAQLAMTLGIPFYPRTLEGKDAILTSSKGFETEFSSLIKKFTELKTVPKEVTL